MVRTEAGPRWVEFRYKKSPKFCYLCGCIGHNFKSCDRRLEGVIGKKERNMEQMRSSFPRSSTKKLDSNTKENTKNRNVTAKALALVIKHTHIPDFEGNKEKEVKDEEKEEGNNAPSTSREIYMNFSATKHYGKKMELSTSEPAKTILENVVFWSGKSSNNGFVIDKTSSGYGTENIYKSRKWKRLVADMSNRKPLSIITMVDKNQRVCSDSRVRLRDEEAMLDEPEHPENKKDWRMMEKGRGMIDVKGKRRLSSSLGVGDVGGGGERDKGTGEEAEALVEVAAEEGQGDGGREGRGWGGAEGLKLLGRVQLWYLHHYGVDNDIARSRTLDHQFGVVDCWPAYRFGCEQYEPSFDRVGDFYEAIGIDACILVEYACLNPFGGLRSDSIPRPSRPVV
ncbi:hypothetical protein ACH5RR_003651, partial [Cinchona calisaya]